MTFSTRTMPLSTAHRWRMCQHYFVAALIFAALLMVYIVVARPQVEFPLNDDWGYSQAVRHLLSTGELRISDWASATTIFQTYWGALFARLLGGFSLVAMRWSTLAFSFIAVMALYDLFLQLDLSHRVALFGAVVALVSPMFGYLSYTFMSDIFYFGLMALSISAYLRGIRRRAMGWLLVGSIFAALAFLTRQLGAVLPIAAALALLVFERRFVWKQLLAVFVIPAMTGVVYFAWLQIVGTPWALQFFSLQGTVNQLAIPLEYIPRTILRMLLTAFYIGLLTLPAVLAMVISRRSMFRVKSRAFKVYIVWLVALGTFALVIGRPMPYLANVINGRGMGTLTLLGLKEPITPSWVFWCVTLIAPFVGAVQGTLWTEVILHARRELRRPVAILLLASAGMAVLIMSIFVYFWDEYLFVFVPIGLYLTLRGVRITHAGWIMALLACVLIGIYSVIELGDHMAWNAARWEAGQRLVQQGVPPGEIDGGLEWVGWYEFEKALPQALAAGRQNELWAWYDWTPHRFFLAFESLEGYRVIDRVAYHTPVINRVGYVYVLTKTQP